MSERTFTRDEAIHLLVGTLTKVTIDAGASLAQVVGPEMAAEMTLDVLEAQQAAFEALGVTEDDVRRVAEGLDEEARV